MKKIFMCVNYPMYNPAIGISKKIKTQIETFEKLGYSVTFSAYVSDGIVIINNNEVKYKYQFPSVFSNPIRGVLRSRKLMESCCYYLKNASLKFDLGFIRWNAMDNWFMKALKQLDMSCNKVLMDCHGYHPGYCINGLKSAYIKYWTDFNKKKVHKYIDLCLIEFKDDTVFDVPAMAIDTGIDVSRYTPHEYDGDPNAINMISVANEQSYHGYDRVIDGINCYKGDRIVRLHLVGKMSRRTVKKINDLKLNDKVILYGYQTGEKLQYIYRKCNIGVGPLAPHRAGNKQGTGIKTKEYFAIGLPYFYAGQELLVPEDYPYTLKFKAEDTPIDIKRVIEFYDSIKEEENIQENMRDFAKSYYSWEKMFRKALSIMNCD